MLLIPCLDDDDRANTCRSNLDIPRSQAAVLGLEAVAILRDGFYRAPSGRRVDLAPLLAHALAARMSVPPDAFRPHVVPRPPPDTAPAHLHRRLTRTPTPTPSPYWPPWAALLWRSFHIDPLACPLCGSLMHLRTVVLPPASLDVLAGLGAAASRAPPTTLPRSDLNLVS